MPAAKQGGLQSDRTKIQVLESTLPEQIIGQAQQLYEQCFTGYSVLEPEGFLRRACAPIDDSLFDSSSIAWVLLWDTTTSVEQLVGMVTLSPFAKSSLFVADLCIKREMRRLFNVQS